jgi:3',5'-nucleoside bisphosphate phosphatase
LIDLHLHTTASDGHLRPSDLVEAAHAAGLTTMSITDHDTTAGLEEGRTAAQALGIAFVPGIEISAVAEGRDLHVLGYFIDVGSSVLRALLERQQVDRVRRVSAMADRLAALGCPIDPEPVLADARRGRSVGRPQIALALVDAGHVRTRDEAFTRYLEHGGPAYVARAGTSPEAVIEVIHEAGGIASLAHPGVSRRDHLIPALVDAGLDAIEARHSDHDAAAEAHYRSLARTHRLLVTGGSDFHGEAGHRAAGLGRVTLPLEDYAALRAAVPRSAQL